MIGIAATSFMPREGEHRIITAVAADRRAFATIAAERTYFATAAVGIFLLMYALQLLK